MPCYASSSEQVWRFFLLSHSHPPIRRPPPYSLKKPLTETHPDLIPHPSICVFARKLYKKSFILGYKLHTATTKPLVSLFCNLLPPFVCNSKAPIQQTCCS